MLDHIARSEGTADKAGGGYNTSLANGLLLPGGAEQELTGKTLDEIDELQTGMLRHPKNRWNSSAIGRYQIVRTTLRSLRNKLGLKGTDLYDDKTQDRLGAELARARGADSVGLQQEWASLVGSKNAKAVELMRQVDPKSSTMPMERPAPETGDTLPSGAPAVLRPKSMPNAPGVVMDPKAGERIEKGLDGLSKLPVSAWEANPFRSSPLGSWSNSSTSTTNNISTGPVTNNVSGVGDAKQAAEVIGQKTSRVHADLLRNLQGATA